MNDDTTGTGPDPGEVLDARLAARLAALSATYSPRVEADAVAAERERIRQLAIRTHAVTVSQTGRMMPFEELLRHSPEENAELLRQVVEDARAARNPAVEGLQAPRPVVRALPARDGQQETAPAVTPGQAAYEARQRSLWSRHGMPDGGPLPTPWEALTDGQRADEEAAASAVAGHLAAGFEAARAREGYPPADALQAENASLRDQLAEQSRQRNRLVGDYNELDDRHATLLEEILRNADEDINGGDEAPEYLAEAYVRHLEGQIAGADESIASLRRQCSELAGELGAAKAGNAEYRAELAEVRRITYQGGQDAASVRRELLAYLEGHGAATVPARPPVVCLCGSTRFYDEFRRANLRLTLAGEIVLSIGCDTGPDGDMAAAVESGTDPDVARDRLVALHMRKIDMCDYVLVINPGGYVGESTRSEIGYAIAHGKPVRYLEARDVA